MKRWIFFILVLSFPLAANAAEPKIPKLSKEDALSIAERTPEAKALESLYNGALTSCLDKKAVLPCESQWVTCIDNAWVVQFTLKSSCAVKTDGRLSLNLLIDGETGQIISRYPEIEYFNDTHFCRDNGDCSFVGAATSRPAECLNFIHAAFVTTEGAAIQTEHCACQQTQCAVSK